MNRNGFYLFGESAMPVKRKPAKVLVRAVAAGADVSSDSIAKQLTAQQQRQQQQQWVKMNSRCYHITTSKSKQGSNKAAAAAVLALHGNSAPWQTHLDPYHISASTPVQPSAAAAAAAFKALMRRQEVWSIYACHYAQLYGMCGLLTWLPTFFGDYCWVRVGDLGAYAPLPCLLQDAAGAGAGALADQLLTKYKLSCAIRASRAAVVHCWCHTDKTGLQQLQLPSQTKQQRPQNAGHAWPCGMPYGSGITPYGRFTRNSVSTHNSNSELSALTHDAVSVKHLDIKPNNAGMCWSWQYRCYTCRARKCTTNWLGSGQTANWPLVFD